MLIHNPRLKKHVVPCFLKNKRFEILFFVTLDERSNFIQYLFNVYSMLIQCLFNVYSMFRSQKYKNITSTLQQFILVVGVLVVVVGVVVGVVVVVVMTQSMTLTNFQFDPFFPPIYRFSH